MYKELHVSVRLQTLQSNGSRKVKTYMKKKNERNEWKRLF